MNPPTYTKTLSISVEEITRLLEVYVDSECAVTMAHAVWEDMREIRFPIVPSHFNQPKMWDELGVIRQAEYQLPKNQFNINSPVGSESLDGSFLTCGNLLRLSQCALLGRTYIPGLWPSAFAKRIKGRGHLDALNEIWWLKFWRGIASVAPGPKQTANDTDFEWQIQTNDGLTKCLVNLEVKRRTSNINKFFKEQRPNASVSDIAKKFGTVSADTANVAALTLYHNIPRDVERSVREWFESQPYLHGLLIWTEGHLGGPPFRKYFKSSHRWVEFLLNEPEAEDLKVAGHSRGTSCEVNEVPAFLAKLAAQIDAPKILRPW